MYILKPLSVPFTHYIDYEAMHGAWRDIAHDWARHSQVDERHLYEDGIFYLVLPFEWLDFVEESIVQETVQLLRSYELRLFRDQETYDAMIDKIGRSAYNQSGYDLAEYLELLVLMYHFKSILPREMIKPNTFAIKFEW